MKCEACAGDPSIDTDVQTTLIEVNGIGGHVLCIPCLTAMNLAEEINPYRAREAAAAHYCSFVVRWAARNERDFDGVRRSLEEAALRQAEAAQETYRAYVQWIHARQAESEAA